MGSSFGSWINIEEKMPKTEERVILHTVSTVRGKKYEHITIGIYEDGKINEDVAEDGEKGGFIVPKGWWEVGVYSEVISEIDDEVIAWMPLPCTEEAY